MIIVCSSCPGENEYLLSSWRLESLGVPGRNPLGPDAPGSLTVPDLDNSIGRIPPELRPLLHAGVGCTKEAVGLSFQGVLLAVLALH